MRILIVEDELVARVNAQLRMNNVQAPKDYIEAGDLKLNLKIAH